MSDVPSWSDLKADLNSNLDDYQLNERLFARLEGWGWPLIGTAQISFEENASAYDYVDRMEVAAEAATQIFRSLIWDDETYEPLLTLHRQNGHWLAKLEVDAEHVSAGTDGAFSGDFALISEDARPGKAIMKVSIEMRSIIAQAKLAAEQSPEM